MRSSELFLAALFSSIILLSLAGAEQQVTVGVTIVPAVEEGDIVQITNEEFRDEEALVISVDKEKKEAIVSLLNLNSTQVTVSLENVNVLRKKTAEEEQLGSLNPDSRNILIFMISIVIILALIAFGRKKKKEAKKKHKTKTIKKVTGAKRRMRK